MATYANALKYAQEHADKINKTVYVWDSGPELGDWGWAVTHRTDPDPEDMITIQPIRRA